MRSHLIWPSSLLMLMCTIGCASKTGGADSSADSGGADTAESSAPEERCDGEDNDGDGRVDERFPDTDGDGIADCVDEEECDGLDNDGDGKVDEGFDADADGIPDCDEVEECNGLDDDADGEIDEDFDLDGDGHTTCGASPDCDDSDPLTSPSADELDSDEQDNDCDGMVDETSWRPGDLVITELMTDPVAVLDTRGEWIEIANTTDRSVALNGLRLSSSTGSQLLARPDWMWIEPGAAVVLGLAMSPAANGGVPVDYLYSGIDLSAESDRLSLGFEGLVIDAVAWDELSPHSAGATLSLDPVHTNSVENDRVESWCSAATPWAELSDLGTPGVTNSLCPHIDHDGDGLSADDGDCDDAEASVYPGAPEIDVGVDNDCDGLAASQPVAWADYDVDASTLSSCDSLQLDGSRSYDPDGDPLSFSWSLAAVPEGSGADSSWLSTTSERPTFTPDEPGDYRFSLTVSDGMLSSAESHLTLTLAEPDLSMLDAGPDQSQEVSTSCSSSSCDDCPAVVFALETDAGGLADVREFSWSASEEWADVGIDDPSSETIYVVVWGVSGEPGATVEDHIEITLSATDCLDQETVDTVILSVSCIGS